MHIVDRRLNPSGKNLANRQRFMRRAKAQIRKAVHESSASRSIKDADEAARSRCRRRACTSPVPPRRAAAGVRDHLLPGNKEYIDGRHHPAPARRRGRRRQRRQPRRRRRGRFPLRPVARGIRRPVPGRPGTARPGKAQGREHGERKLAAAPATPSPARRPIWRCCAPCATACPGGSRCGGQSPRSSQHCGRKSRRWTARRDERRRRRELRPSCDASCGAPAHPLYRPVRRALPAGSSDPKPVAQAVMFCLMDVSGSMTEHMKDLAKRFYMLLYLFLTRRYKHVDVVFIRHTHEAQEVDEDTFFTARRPAAPWFPPRWTRCCECVADALPARTRGTSTPPRHRTATTRPATTTGRRVC